jgi:phosphoserine phosphatase
VLGTKLEVRDGKLTGRFITPNCYGQEKVNRLKQVLNEPRQAYSIKAFGDSRGDKELLEYADQGHYKPFR